MFSDKKIQVFVDVEKSSWNESEKQKTLFTCSEVKFPPKNLCFSLEKEPNTPKLGPKKKNKKNN